MEQILSFWSRPLLRREQIQFWQSCPQAPEIVSSHLNKKADGKLVFFKENDSIV